MARKPAPFDPCLAPLSRLASRFPDMEGQVIWWEDGNWQAQDDDEAMLDAEEVVFYAEGLLAEGFAMVWHALAEPEMPDRVVLLRLFFWQGDAPPAPDPDGWHLQAQGRWPSA
ncbi:MAG: hypothetical protein R3D63_11570 [Paracoccaceae bacterium]